MPAGDDVRTSGIINSSTGSKIAENPIAQAGISTKTEFAPIDVDAMPGGSGPNFADNNNAQNLTKLALTAATR